MHFNCLKNCLDTELKETFELVKFKLIIIISLPIKTTALNI